MEGGFEYVTKWRIAGSSGKEKRLKQSHLNWVLDYPCGVKV
jgi:hypothetical protein